MQELKPSLSEIQDWLLCTLKHSSQVEYYLHQLNLGKNDPQRPHDISGKGSKFSWPVIKGLALQHDKKDKEFFKKNILPSIEYHRKYQYHHQKWNTDNPNATADDMKVGAVDALSSLLDNRKYQGGTHNFEEIITVIKSNEPHKVKWMWMVYSRMKRLPQPDLDKITLETIPNIGISEENHKKTKLITSKTLEMLRTQYGYKI